MYRYIIFKENVLIFYNQCEQVDPFKLKQVCFLDQNIIFFCIYSSNLSNQDQVFNTCNQGTFCIINLETNPGKIGFLQCKVINLENSVKTCVGQRQVFNVQYELYMLQGAVC